jgi:hypothetical protein
MRPWISCISWSCLSGARGCPRRVARHAAAFVISFVNKGESHTEPCSGDAVRLPLPPLAAAMRSYSYDRFFHSGYSAVFGLLRIQLPRSARVIECHSRVLLGGDAILALCSADASIALKSKAEIHSASPRAVTHEHPSFPTPLSSGTKR